MSAWIGKKRKEDRYNHLVALVGLSLAFIVTYSVSPLILLSMCYYNGLPIKIFMFGVFPIMIAIWSYRVALQIREIGWRAYLFPEPIEK